MTEQQFDVFLAHSSQDKPLIRQIYQKLKAAGIKPWLDEREIAPGTRFQDEIQQAIGSIKTAAIFFGTGGIGRWQALELKAFISQCVTRDIPVIPVLLPGVMEIPEELLFLREFHAVRFQENIDENDALYQLTWGITRIRPREIIDCNQKIGLQDTSRKGGNPPGITSSDLASTDLDSLLNGLSEENFKLEDLEIDSLLKNTSDFESLSNNSQRSTEKSGDHPIKLSSEDLTNEPRVRLINSKIIYFLMTISASIILISWISTLLPTDSDGETQVANDSVEYELPPPSNESGSREDNIFSEEDALTLASNFLEAKKTFFDRYYDSNEADSLLKNLFTNDSPRGKKINDIIWEERQEGIYIKYYGQGIEAHRNFVLLSENEANIEIKIREEWAQCYVESDRFVSRSFPRQDTNWYRLSAKLESGTWKLYDLETIEQLDNLDLTSGNTPEYNVDFCSDLT